MEAGVEDWNALVMPSAAQAYPASKPEHKPAPKLSPNLDLLRAFAVLCVLVDHLAAAFTGHQRLIGLGRFGVVLFFVHTSLVLMESLERMQRSATGWRLTFAFWIRRAFRIYPLAVVCIVVVEVFRVPPTPLGHAHAFEGAKYLLSNLLLIQNLTYSNQSLNVLWTLPLELQMYVLLPFVFFLLLRSRRYASLVLWACSIPLALAMPHVSERLSVFHFAPCFLAGVVAFDLLRRKVPRTLPAWVWPVGLAIALIAFRPTAGSDSPAGLARMWCIPLGVAILYVSTRETSHTGRTRVAQWIAERSYGVYLTHNILIWFALTYLGSGTRIPFLAVCLPLVPAVLFRAIEQPLMQLGARLSRDMLQPVRPVYASLRAAA